MRKNIVAGNWKMNTTLAEAIELAEGVKKVVAEKKTTNADVVIAPPYVNLTEVAKVIEGTDIILASQNCADEKSGAYTGEISVDMLASIGVKAVILGHSERREYYNEGNETLTKKVALVLEKSMTPIFCIGEVLSERESGKYFEVVKEQLSGGLFNLSAEDFAKVVIAYEPVWAIGTGVTASSDQAQEIHEFIRKTIADKYNAEIADNTTILYGGSCKPTNAQELFGKADVDGGLIGGAALKAEDFVGIINGF